MEKIILREKPRLLGIIASEYFELSNDQAIKRDRFYYKFMGVPALKFTKANWLISILSIIADLFSNIGSGKIYKKQIFLIFNYSDLQNRKDLTGCDIVQVEKFQKMLAIKIPLQ